MRGQIAKIIILISKDNDEINKDLFDEVNKLVKTIFIDVAFNIAIEEVEDKLTDLVINFIEELSIVKDKKFLLENFITKLNSMDEQEIYKDNDLEKITYQIYYYLIKKIINIIKNYKKKRSKEILLSNLNEHYIVIQYSVDNYKKRLRELIENLEYISLSNDEKQFIYLMYNNGDVLTVKEIAIVFNISVQAVYQRINRITKHYQKINQ